jgi:NTP pyrophosphatase (non-canonical NTP hydrolase)
MITGKTTNRLWALVEAADTRYGDYASTHEALGVACEEWDELRTAVHANDLAAVQKEALDLAAVLIRLVDQLDRSESLRRRSIP